MPGPRTSATHHCPLLSKGNCRYDKAPFGTRYCTAHQTYCRKGHPRTFLKSEGCTTCTANAERRKQMLLRIRVLHMIANDATQYERWQQLLLHVHHHPCLSKARRHQRPTSRASVDSHYLYLSNDKSCSLMTLGHVSRVIRFQTRILAISRTFVERYPT